MAQLEDHYWWFAGRKKMAVAMVQAACPAKNLAILDLGCGTGAVTKELAKLGSVAALDMSPEALRFGQTKVRESQTSWILGDGSRLPFAEGQFDCAVGLDVFEHIEGDERAFAEAFRVLKPGGGLVLTVPAFRWLWGPHDVALHHFRRYHRSELEGKLRQAGFQIERLSFAVFLLFPLVVVRRLLERMSRGPARTSLPAVPDWLNRLLIRTWDWELNLIRLFGRLPWGSSLVAVARKP